MGNSIEESLGEKLKREKLLQCPSCQQQFDLQGKVPRMICSNQHNLCDQCLQQLRPKSCPECKELLWIKKNKNAVLTYILERIQDPNKPRQMQETSFKGEQVQYESPEGRTSNLSQSPSKKTFKVKTAKQSVPNLNLELYKEEREFRKKYSVANIFTAEREAAEVDSKCKTKEETFEDILQKQVEDFQIMAFRDILLHKTPPQNVLNLQLHLYKIPKIFDFLGRFTNLTRLNLNKNRICRIQNFSELKFLNYLSISDNHIETIQNLEGLSELRNLYLNKNRIEQIQNLESLTNLEFLGLGFNAIHKMERIGHLTNIRWLSLETNYLTRIQGIGTLKKLEIILLGSNDITVFEGFDGLQSLQEIHLEGNKIDDLRTALSMKNLRKLRLEDNPGLKDDHSKEYVKFMEIIEAKSKGIEKTDDGCVVY